ncbi:hypothetical protein VNO78_33960 [Psophocarpus tetragonolobus]|uniref:Uncharacterized protein n=1 Tax=Psophocarpus tetragonolobus TaxID=3891 RepID=A0AAN9P1Y3_PSOTE
MVALKKAFADVILNTVKESASRVVASEQRALMFQLELASSKEEALRMLIRLKQMMDAKNIVRNLGSLVMFWDALIFENDCLDMCHTIIDTTIDWHSLITKVQKVQMIGRVGIHLSTMMAEAEKASLEQQRRIEELEAQLNEAEDIVTDLRGELKLVYLMLEKTRNSQVQPMNEQNIKQVATFQESAKPETLICSPHKELESVTSYDVANKSLVMNVLDDKCCNSKQQTEQLHISILEDSGCHESDFASIIMRSKEPDLRRNGFTQRIHALEGNLLDEKLLMQDVQNKHYGKLRKCKIKKHIKCHRIPKWKIFSCYKSRFLPSCTVHVHLNDNCKSRKVVCSLPSIKHSAISKWKRRRRHRHLGMRSSAFRSCKPLFVLKQCSSVCDDKKFCGDESVAKMKSVSPLTDVEPVKGTTGVTKSVQAVNKFELVEKDNRLLNLEESSALNLTGPSSDMKVEVFDVLSTNTDLKDAQVFEENDRSSRQVGDSRLLKYTFQRKRKKLGNTDQNIDSEKSAVKRRVEEKPNGSTEYQNLA